MLDKTTNAPINLYFDKTPSGKILNRYSRDINKIDQEIPRYDDSVNFAHVLTIFNTHIFYSKPFIVEISFGQWNALYEQYLTSTLQPSTGK